MLVCVQYSTSANPSGSISPLACAQRRMSRFCLLSLGGASTCVLSCCGTCVELCARMLTNPPRRPRVSKLGWGSHVQLPLSNFTRPHEIGPSAAEYSYGAASADPHCSSYRTDFFIFLDRLVALRTAFVRWRHIHTKPGGVH